jgi:hypothetical protein
MEEEDKNNTEKTNKNFYNGYSTMTLVDATTTTTSNTMIIRINQVPNIQIELLYLVLQTTQITSEVHNDMG